MVAVCEARLGRALTDAERDVLARRVKGAEAEKVAGVVATMEFTALASWLAG